MCCVLVVRCGLSMCFLVGDSLFVCRLLCVVVCGEYGLDCWLYGFDMWLLFEVCCWAFVVDCCVCGACCCIKKAGSWSVV